VHGARRINRTKFRATERDEAIAHAQRWSQSNCLGHYWSAVYALRRASDVFDQRELITTFNLDRD
jgi:hypothetical protein